MKRGFHKVTHAELFEIQKRWNLKSEPQFFRHVANEIYFSKTKSEEVVIRITDKDSRSLNEIYAELAWVEHLKKNNLQVCQVISSVNGSTVEEINDKLVVVFKRFPGQRIDDADLTEKQVKLWAQTMAQMHLATANYQPGPYKRNLWFNDSIYQKATSALDKADEEVQYKFKELDHKIRKWPRNRENFGLIHSDLHTGNFFFDDHELLVFDFDDSCYNFFYVDVAVPIRILCRELSSHDLIDKKEKYLKIFFYEYFAKLPPQTNWKVEFELCYRYYGLIIHLWLLAIMKDRDLTIEMKNDFQESIDLNRAQSLSPEITEVLSQF